MSQELISHKGYVVAIEPDKILVSIVSESACSACHAKGFCSAADAKEKIIETPNRHPNKYSIGDQVEVTLRKSHGLKAVLFGYFLPFVLLIATLLTIYETTGKQGLAGLFSLIILAPYYFVLYLFRNKLKSAFEFALKS